MWNSYLASNRQLYLESFQVCQYFDWCRGSILLMSIMSIPPRGEKEFCTHAIYFVSTLPGGIVIFGVSPVNYSDSAKPGWEHFFIDLL